MSRLTPSSRPLCVLGRALVICLIFVTAAGYAQEAIPFAGTLVHPDRILVREHERSARSAGPDPTLAQLGLKARALAPTGKGRLLMLESVVDPDRSLDAEARVARLAKHLSRLRATGRYAYVEPDYVVQASALPSDGALADGTLWGLVNTGQSGGVADADIDAEMAWDITTGSSSVIVAVIDSGIRATHQELASRMWVNPGEIAGNGIDDDGDGYVDNLHGIDAFNQDGDPTDDNDHGTHVAGTIGAAANDGHPHVGVAWNVRLMACKFLGADGSGYVSGAIDCIDFAVANGARVLNNSWGGGGYSQALHDAIVAARDAGVLFVAAAGNESSNNDTRPAYPASYAVDNILSVAALDRSDHLASFSNYGSSTVHLGAPGVDIYSCVSDADDAYASFSGTSMAAPHVSGAAALLLARWPDLSLVELRTRLLASTVPVSELSGRVTTGGRLNAHQALTIQPDGRLDLALTTDRPAPFIAGETVTLRLAVADLSPVLGAAVSADAGPAGAVLFNDAGLVPDRVAGDATHTATVVVPADALELTVALQATAPGYVAATLQRTFAIVHPAANNNFAGRIALSAASLTTVADNRAANLEPGEPVHAGVPGGRSLWWSWTAPSAGTVTISTAGSTIDTLLAAYTGSDLASLQYIAANDDASFDLTSEISFNTQAGQTYHLAVDGYGGAGGDLSLSVKLGALRPSPLNDAFASRIPLSGANLSVSAANRTASIEPGEPLHANAPGGRSLWWTWVAPNDGVAVVHTEGSDFDTLLAVYTGTDLSDLVPVASDNNDGLGSTSRVVFSVVAGRSYHLAVDGHYGATGLAALRVIHYIAPPLPAHDSFAARTQLVGATAVVTGSTLFATREAGEPEHANNAGGASVWWSWTAPTSGPYTVHSTGAHFDTLLAVYTGGAIDQLARVAANDHGPIGDGSSEVGFDAVAGQTYHVCLDGMNRGFGPARGDYLLTLAPGAAPSPANDSFASRLVIPGSSAIVWAHNANATRESGEPLHYDEPGGASVWWTWTAPSSGYFSFDIEGANLFGVLAVYTGSTLATLSEVDSDFERVTFRAVAGVGYQIAVDGWSFEDFIFTGAIRLRLTPHTAPANNQFASRQLLPGYAAEVDAVSIAATKESGEPSHAGSSGGASVWWTWRAPASGTVTVHTEGSEFDTLLAVYTGTTVSALTLRASDDDSGEGSASRLTFTAVAGTFYHIAVDGYLGRSGRLRLSLSHSGYAAAPANDAFANRFSLVGASGSVSGLNTRATQELGELNHGGVVGGTSLWWTWIAPADGELTLDTAGSGFDTLLAVYTGDGLPTLTAAAFNDQNPAGGTTSRLTLPVRANIAYHIVVDGKNYASGSAFLGYVFEAAPPPGDRFDRYLARHFSSAQLVQPTIVGPLADPDGDGRANLLEYAFGLAPAAIEAASPVASAYVAGRLTMTFVRRLDAPDLAYLPEVSDTLGVWSGGSDQVETVATELLDDTRELVTVRDRVGGPRRFLRLRVELRPAE